MAQSMGLIPQMIDGRRITDSMLDGGHDLCWQINKKYCGSITSNSNAMGFSGADGNPVRNHPTINYAL
jgi:acetylglutamate kinase